MQEARCRRFAPAVLDRHLKDAEALVVARVEVRDLSLLQRLRRFQKDVVQLVRLLEILDVERAVAESGVREGLVLVKDQHHWS